MICDLQEQDDADMGDEDVEEEPAPQLSKENAGLVSLSDQPVSRWLNLLNMDVIRMRNKPQEAVKKPEAAPFFLPTIQGLEFKFQVENNPGDEVRTQNTLETVSAPFFTNQISLRVLEDQNLSEESVSVTSRDRKFVIFERTKQAAFNSTSVSVAIKSRENISIEELLGFCELPSAMFRIKQL